MDRITVTPRQCGGRPWIRVKDVPDMLAKGATEAEILKDHP
jgi:uncharacterized protein (DUF433 family)